MTDRNEIIFVPLSEIIYLQAKESYTDIYRNDANIYIMTKNLGHYSEMLSNHSNFFRIHYSTIINIDYISKIVKMETNNRYKIELNDGKTFEVSQRRVTEFKKIIRH